jgi:sec-independent protein translocase protein TatB
VFSNLNWWEIAVLALIGLFIFGPERLPKVISDAIRTIRSVRDMARNATNDLSRELGTDVKLEDLHPKTFIRKHLLSEEDEASLRRPFDDAYQQVKGVADDVNDTTGRRPGGTTTPPEQTAPTTMGQGTYPTQPTADQPYTGSGQDGSGYPQAGYASSNYNSSSYNGAPAWGEPSGYGNSPTQYGQPGPNRPRHAADGYDDDAT